MFTFVDELFLEFTHYGKRLKGFILFALRIISDFEVGSVEGCLIAFQLQKITETNSSE